MGLLSTPIGLGAKAVAGLMDMSTPARMARAKEQGFDDRDFYHATGANIKEFDNSKIGSTTDEGWFGRGHYFTPSKDYANQFVPSTGNANVLPVKLKADNQYDWRANETESQGRGMAIANDEMRQLKTDQIKEAGYTGVDVYDDVVQLGEDEVLNPKQWEAVKKYYVNKLGSFPQWLKKESVEKTLRKGSPKWEYLEIYGPEFVDAMPQKRILKERMIFDTKNIRSKFATFDPAKTSSSNLLASNPVATTSAGILSAIAASQSNDTYADYSPANLARLRNDDVGGYQAAQSPQLARAAELMGQVNERGVDDPLMGFVSPRMPNELMNKMAYNDKRGIADYLKSAAGLLGFY